MKQSHLKFHLQRPNELKISVIVGKINNRDGLLFVLNGSDVLDFNKIVFIQKHVLNF